MSTPIELARATIAGYEVIALLDGGRLLLAAPDGKAIHVALDDAHAVGRFLVDTVERALLHNARTEAT